MNANKLTFRLRNVSASDSGQQAVPLNETKYTIYVATSPGNFVGVNGSMTLEQLNEKYSKLIKPLEVYYSSRKEDKWNSQLF